jgi:hypothetical protein
MGDGDPDLVNVCLSMSDNGSGIAYSAFGISDAVPYIGNV